MTLAPEELPPAGSPERRRLGFMLAIFGAVGVLLVGVALAFAVAPIDADEGPLGLEAQRRQLVAFLDASEAAIDTAAVAAGDADGSLVSTSAAAGSAATLMSDLARTMRSLSASLRISIFGSQPFATAADDMERVAGQAGTVAQDLDRAASSVRVAADDMAALAGALVDMRAEILSIRAGMDDPIEIGPWRLLLVAMLAWLAIPAVVSLWIGLHWLRPGARRPARTRQRAAVPPAISRD